MIDFLFLLVDQISSYVAPPYPISDDTGYTPYNKPSAIAHWLQNERPPEDVIDDEITMAWHKI